MPVSLNAEQRRRALLVLLLCATGLAHGEFSVTELSAQLAPAALTVNAEIDLALTSKVEEAISKGIELPLILELRLVQERKYWWDRRVATWILHRSLRYHALSGQYLVHAEDEESFSTLNGALHNLGQLDNLVLPLPADTALPEAGYRVQLRVHLDIEALPPPLRPVAYTNLSWHLNSGWSEWNVAASAP